MPDSIPVLYSYWRSSCSWRVRIALNLKGIQYKTQSVENMSKEEILEKSPFGFVPALVLNENITLVESLGIIEYLEEKFPELPTLFPGSLEDRANIRALALQFIANIQPLQNYSVLLHVSPDNETKRNEWAQHWISRIFDRLEMVLKKTAGKYAYGDALSLIDVCIPPQVYNAKRYQLDLTPYPTIVRLNETLSQIPEFIAASCQNQPDTPESERL